MQSEVGQTAGTLTPGGIPIADSTGRHSQLCSIATVLPAMHAGVSGRTRIRAWSSKYPGARGAPNRTPENAHTPRVRIPNNHPASRNALAVLSGARPGSNSAKSPRVTITRSCSRNVLTTPTSGPLTGRVSGKSNKSGSRSAAMVLIAPSYRGELQRSSTAPPSTGQQVDILRLTRFGGLRPLRCGRDARSRRPASPSASHRRSHLQTVWRDTPTASEAAATDQPNTLIRSTNNVRSNGVNRELACPMRASGLSRELFSSTTQPGRPSNQVSITSLDSTAGYCCAIQRSSAGSWCGHRKWTAPASTTTPSCPKKSVRVRYSDAMDRPSSKLRQVTLP